ncbi:3',5'-cyclic-AMP phosphodiesterase [Pseudomaricurvus hydrocarbonicus]|nr:3',5'-cyclic-AMP phosphodiesterase [Aestuariicella hydrocarbonica]
MRLIQITDCHLGSRPGDTLLGLNTDESLSDVLQCLSQREGRANFVVASGDVAAEPTVEAYERFLETLRDQFDRPVAWLSGNHDLDAMMRTFPVEAVQREYLEFDHWQVILLDSSVPGFEHGEIALEELARLRQCLEASNKHALVFVHHQPVPVGCDWIDQYVIRNAPQLLDLLSEYTHVKGLVWGHVHQEFQSAHKHFMLRSTPSTCIQFKPNSTEFALDTTMPGYRWFELYDDGRLETGVDRIDAKSYGIDFASSGY